MLHDYTNKQSVAIYTDHTLFIIIVNREERGRGEREREREKKDQAQVIIQALSVCLSAQWYGRQ